MLVTLFGIVTDVTLPSDANAEFPILLTGRPLVMLGMVTAPPGPVYPVMVIAPLLVVKLNWAFTTTGIARSSGDISMAAQAIGSC